MKELLEKIMEGLNKIVVYASSPPMSSHDRWYHGLAKKLITSIEAELAKPESPEPQTSFTREESRAIEQRINDALDDNQPWGLRTEPQSGADDLVEALVSDPNFTGWIRSEGRKPAAESAVKIILAKLNEAKHGQ